MTTLPEDLARHAAERPASPAVLDAGGTWTWADLDRLATSIAGAVLARVGPGDRVGLAVGGTAVGIAAVHGLARAGVTAVLVHPRLTAAEVASLLETAGCRTLVIDPATGMEAPAGVGAVRLGAIRLDAIGGGGASRVILATGEFVVPTSGTTARPKLVRLPLDRLAASAAAWNAFLPPATGWLLSLGLSHVAGLGIVTRAAEAGVPIVVPAKNDATGMLDAIATTARGGVQVSHLSLVAAQLLGMLNATGDAQPPEGIRVVILGGGPIPAALVQRAVAAGWPVVPSYGMTETASGIVALPAAEAAQHPRTVGRPLPGVELRIAGGGEVQVRGPMRFAGYLDDPGATTGAHTDDGWLRTGDLGRLDGDGRLTVDGRADDVIVSGGENISPAEVEAALAAHPAVAEVAVVGVPDPTWGHVPVAMLVMEPGANASDDELTAHARARLARFKVPARFVRVPSLPHTSLGKIERRSLPAPMIRQDLTLDDGQPIAVRTVKAVDPAAPTAVVLHATLSSGEQLASLARRLAERYRVVLIDRRGTADSPMAEAARVPVARHVADVIAVLDAFGIERALVVGHSFGGVVALRVAAEHPDRVAAVVAWEPPYLPVASDAVRAGFASLAGDMDIAFRVGGAEAAARRFLEAVSGAGAWDRLHARQREDVTRQGAGALADAAMPGLGPDGLEQIAAPAVIATGGASNPFYRPIADALAQRIGPAATREDLPGLTHMAPITDAAAIADLVLGHAAAPSASHAQETPDMTEPTLPTPAPSGLATDHGNASPPTQVGAMFDRISGVYDLMNLVISGFQEPRWRRRAVLAAGVGIGDAVMDVATGTGKVAASLKDQVGPSGRVLGVDLAPKMIERAHKAFAARPGLDFVVGNAMELPGEDGAFDAATIAFGMRNLPDYGRGFAEMRRVVRPGGRVVCLEIARPNHLIARLGRVWFERIVPWIGRRAGQGDAYGYLVESVRNYPGPERIAQIMREAGLEDVSWTPMTLGMVTIHVGRRPAG